jgi:hypothetical protein
MAVNPCLSSYRKKFKTRKIELARHESYIEDKE